MNEFYGPFLAKLNDLRTEPYNKDQDINKLNEIKRDALYFLWQKEYMIFTIIYALITGRMLYETKKMRQSQTEPDVFITIQPMDRINTVSRPGSSPPKGEYKKELNLNPG